jgi:sugar-specific transcriptional regulator TrmB
MSTSLVDDFALYLNEMGLSGYESRAYLAVLQGGLSTATEISDAADIPQSRVYDILEDLEEKGFVTLQPGRPKKFGPIEPELAVNQYVEFKRNQFERKISQTRKIGEEFTTELDEENFQYRTNDEIDVFWSYKGKNYILSQFGEYCQSASEDIRMIMKGDSFRRMVNHHKEVLSRCYEHGVDIRIIVPYDEIDDVVIETAREWADIRSGPNIEGRIYLFDSERVLVSWKSDQEDRFVAMATQSSQLQLTFGQLFDLFWENASQ